MAQTRAYLRGIFGADVFSVIDAFFVPKRRGDKQVARYGYYEECATIRDPNNGLHGACKGGNMEVARAMLFIGVGSWWEHQGVLAAFTNGDLELIELVCRNVDVDWNKALYGACRGGHHDLIARCIANGANDWSNGFGGAGRGGHLDIAKDMVGVGTHPSLTAGREIYPGYGIEDGRTGAHSSTCLLAACRGGNAAIVALAIEEGEDNWTRGLGAACRGGHIAIARDMITRGADVSRPPLDDICHNGDVRLLGLFPDVERSKVLLDKLLGCAASHDCVPIIQWAVERGASDFNRALSLACVNDARIGAREMVERGATNADDAVKTAISHGRYDIMAMLVEMRPKALEFSRDMPDHAAIRAKIA